MIDNPMTVLANSVLTGYHSVVGLRQPGTVQKLSLFVVGCS